MIAHVLGRGKVVLQRQINKHTHTYTGEERKSRLLTEVRRIIPFGFSRKARNEMICDGLLMKDLDVP